MPLTHTCPPGAGTIQGVANDLGGRPQEANVAYRDEGFVLVMAGEHILKSLAGRCPLPASPYDPHNIQRRGRALHGPVTRITSLVARLSSTSAIAGIMARILYLNDLGKLARTTLESMTSHGSLADIEFPGVVRAPAQQMGTRGQERAFHKNIQRYVAI